MKASEEEELDYVVPKDAFSEEDIADFRCPRHTAFNGLHYMICKIKSEGNITKNKYFSLYVNDNDLSRNYLKNLNWSDTYMSSSKKDFVYSQNDYLNNYIQFADTKSAVFITVNGVLMGFLYTQFKDTLPFELEKSSHLVLLVSIVLLLVAYVFYF